MTRLALIAGESQGAALGSALSSTAGVVAWQRLSFADVAALSFDAFHSALYVVERDQQGFPSLRGVEDHFNTLAHSGLEQVVVLSSTAVHEPSHHHHDRVAEEPLRPLKQRPLKQRSSEAIEQSRRVGSARHPRTLQEGATEAQCWRTFEDLAATVFKDSKACLTILRPAPLALPNQDLFAGRLTLTLPGFDPVMQFLAPDDLAQAVSLVIAQRASGIFHVVPDQPVPLGRALRLGGMRSLPVPAFLQTAPRGARGADVVNRRRHPATASGKRLRALGFSPRQSSAQAVWKAAGAPTKLQDLANQKIDPYGRDRDYIDALGRNLFPFLHDRYWRVEERGLEQVPKEGRAVLVGMHRGFMPWDGVMALHALAGARGRYPRFLIHPTLVKFPFLAPYMRRLGGLLACQENAAWVLENEGVLGVFPEGIRGAFRSYDKAYELGRFGRDEFVKIALRHRAPIVPFVTVGSAEIFPILKKVRWRWWQRYSEWPCFPITPTMGLVPLPSKWHTLFLAPIAVQERYPPEAAEDREVVRALSREVRTVMEEALADLLARRQSIFHGSIFQQDSAAVEPEEALV